MTSRRLYSIYRKLFLAFGPQHWWPGDTPFEIAIGAILTQNTNWGNVEKAINNLKAKGLLSPKKLHQLSCAKIARLIKPSGYFNIKAKRLKAFLDFLFRDYGGSLKGMSSVSTNRLRNDLLCVNGIGPETADSILLYALKRPVFVVDAYTRRIFSRHRCIKNDADYNTIQEFFTDKLKRNTGLFNEYHALLVRLGKELCLKSRPRCNICPLKEARCAG
ncbi:endonuclease III domain-containing protein [Candidatus Omnitrophota bacterium]